jgi:tRNA C32,U32 (ribose-2'-O)-methylase TrmJ
MGHLQAALSHCGFLDADNPGQTMTRLRRLFTRVRLDDTEVQMLRGALRQLAPGAAASDAFEKPSGKRDQ